MRATGGGSRVIAAGVLAAGIGLTACGGGSEGTGRATPAAAPASQPLASRGQVAAVPAYTVSYHAASRFAEQASFGPTPALVDEIRRKGFAAWIDEQFALPASQIEYGPFERFVDPVPPGEYQTFVRAFPDLAIGAKDQLRLRVTWSIGQFIVVSNRAIDHVAVVPWINLLQQRALGRYDELLVQISTNPAMGAFLNNDQNRPKSEECEHCAPNENFARELMQLFTLGVFRLEADGTPVRDARGRYVETYTQRDVEELARALTGWTYDPEPARRPNRNYGNWRKPMVPSTWPPERDSGAKTVLGRTFAAGQSQRKDLDDAVALLMAHPNIAPFVALRMIQHLVKSDPTPAYVGRVAAVFRNNGRSVAGDMKAVVKAVLLDAEARAGDEPGRAARADGKFREPFQHAMAMWRGLGCRQVPVNEWGPVLGSQDPFRAESVFGFYAPTDRAPGSNLLAPEQRLYTGEDVRNRTSMIEWPSVWRNGRRTYDNYRLAGCDIDAWRDAFVRSPLAFGDLLSARFFRGAMPPTLRSNIEQIMREPWPPWNRDDPTEGALRMIAFALNTPYYGVVK